MIRNQRLWYSALCSIYESRSSGWLEPTSKDLVWSQFIWGKYLQELTWLVSFRGEENRWSNTAGRALGEGSVGWCRGGWPAVPLFIILSPYHLMFVEGVFSRMEEKGREGTTYPLDPSQDIKTWEYRTPPDLRLSLRILLADLWSRRESSLAPRRQRWLAPSHAHIPPVFPIGCRGGSDINGKYLALQTLRRDS